MAASSESFLRQLSSKNGWRSASRRWGGELKQMEELNSICYGSGEENGKMFVMKKRVMVVVDKSAHSKNALMWALTHVANHGDILTLLHIVSPSDKHRFDPSPPPPSSNLQLAHTLGALCKNSRPEVEIEALVIQGPKMETVMSQVKKLEISVLILGQKNPSPPLLNCSSLCLKSSRDKFVEECIDSSMECCLTIGVGKQSGGVGGYLISTRWHNNFWLLAWQLATSSSFFTSIQSNLLYCIVLYCRKIVLLTSI